MIVEGLSTGMVCIQVMKGQKGDGWTSLAFLTSEQDENFSNMPVISPLVRIPSHHISMVPCVEVYAVQDSAQYRSSDFRISACPQPSVGLSIRSPALVLYSASQLKEKVGRHGPVVANTNI